MELALIVAASENNVIGRNNALIWHLPADLKHFKNLTTGHTVVMGRKTFESIGRALPNRRNIVISRTPGLHIAGCEIADSPETMFKKVEQEEKVFIIGGGKIYEQLWDKADLLYLTRVHVSAEGDTCIPAIDPSEWVLLEEESFKADEKNEHDYSFLTYQRKRI